jgi:hypothetical protein
MNNNILLAVPPAVALLLLALIARLTLLVTLFLALIVIIVIVNIVLQLIPHSCLLRDYFMVQKCYLHCLLLRSLPPITHHGQLVCLADWQQMQACQQHIYYLCYHCLFRLRVPMWCALYPVEVERVNHHRPRANCPGHALCVLL